MSAGRNRSSLTKQFVLSTDRNFEAELPVRIRHRDAALRRALDVAFHDQIRLVHFLERACFFAHRDRQRIQSNRSAVKLVDQRLDDSLVPLIKRSEEHTSELQSRLHL